MKFSSKNTIFSILVFCYIVLLYFLIKSILLIAIGIDYNNLDLKISGALNITIIIYAIIMLYLDTQI